MAKIKRRNRKFHQYLRQINQLAELLERRVHLSSNSANTLAESANNPGLTNSALITDAGQISPSTSWLTPSSIKSFYGYNSINFDNGTIAGDGTGQTIAIIDWGNDADIATDLNTFDTHYSISGGTASSFLTIYGQVGSTDVFDPIISEPTASKPTDAESQGSDDEISLDVEWAHALAPGAKIDLIEAADRTSTNVGYAIGYASSLSALGVSVVSMSFATDDASYAFPDSLFSTPGVTYLAATGDYGTYDANGTPYATTPLATTGTGLSGGTDSYNYESLPSTSQNFTVITYVQSTTTATQAGISIRNGTSGAPGNEANVSLIVSPASDGSFRYRPSTGVGESIHDVGTAAVAGTYLALVRQGTTYTAYTSPDDATWTSVGTTNVSTMSGSVTVDLVGAGTSKTASFDPTITEYVPSAAVGASTPATSSNVVAVGGTVVVTSGAGAITNEFAGWGNGANSYAFGGSGGGYSSSEAKPSFQSAINSTSKSSIPDVSFVAGTPVSIYDSDNTSAGWDAVIGTSFSCPAWAAIIAVVDQGRSEAGLPDLTSSQSLASSSNPSVQSLLYGLSPGDFNNETSGSNGTYTANDSAYDLVTGLGTPHVSNIVADLSTSVTFNSGTLTIVGGSEGCSIQGDSVTGSPSSVTIYIHPNNVSYTSATYSGVTNIIASGGSGNDDINMAGITNSSIPCSINGNGGVDSLYGGSGNDTLNGTGGDYFSGGTDSDIYNITSGSMTFSSDAQASSEILTVNATSVALTFTATQNMASLITNGGSITLSGSGTFNGNITGNATLTKSGVGVWTLAGNDGYSGANTISGGTLQLGTPSALGTGTSTVTITPGSGATLDLDGQDIASLHLLTLNGIGVLGNGALINSSSTPATWAGAILLGSSSTIGVSNSITVGPITDSSGGYTLTKSGSSTLTANYIRTGGLSITAGEVKIAATANSPQIAANPSSTASIFSTLSISNGAYFDLTNNDLIVEYTGTSPFSTINGYLSSGYVPYIGSWAGSSSNGNIVTSSVASDGSDLYTHDLGIAEASVLAGLGNDNIDGLNTTSLQAVIVRYSWEGDTDLDDSITTEDLNNLNAAVGWRDFNHDGAVNADDWTLFSLAVNYGQPPALNDQAIISGEGLGSDESVALWDAVEAGNETTFNAEYPTWDYYDADFNHDGVVNSSDITEFNNIGALYGENMVAGTSGNDTFTLQPVASTGLLNILLGSTTVESLPLSSFYNIEIVGGGGNDTLVVDTSEGSLTNDSITFDGAGGNLTLVGSSDSSASSVNVVAGQAAADNEIGLDHIGTFTVGTPVAGVQLNQDGTNNTWTDLTYGSNTTPAFIIQPAVGDIGIVPYDTYFLGTVTFNGSSTESNVFSVASGSLSASIGSYTQSFLIDPLEIVLNGGSAADSVTASGSMSISQLDFDGAGGNDTLTLDAGTSGTTVFADAYGLIDGSCDVPLTNVENVVFNAGTASDTLTVGPWPYTSSIVFNGIVGGDNELILQTGAGENDNDFSASIDSISMNGQSVAFSNVPIVDISTSGTGNTLTVTGVTGSDTIYGFALPSSVDAILLNNVTFEYSAIGQISLYTDGGSDSFTTGYGSYGAPTTPISIFVPAGSNSLQLNAISSISTIVLDGLTVGSGATATIQSGKHLDLYTLDLGSSAPYGTLNIANDLAIIDETGTSADEQMETWANTDNGTGLTSWAGGAGVYDNGTDITIYED